MFPELTQEQNEIIQRAIDAGFVPITPTTAARNPPDEGSPRSRPANPHHSIFRLERGRRRQIEAIHHPAIAQPDVGHLDAHPQGNRPHGSHLGRYRWPVERTFSWIKGLRRMRIRYDRHPTLIDAWLHLALAAVCFKILHQNS